MANQNAMMFHPDLWREVMKPRWTKVIAAARNGGLMLSPTHVLEPEVPPENICAFFDACEKLDWETANKELSKLRD